MIGKLKQTDFYVGNKKYFIVPTRGKIVTITESENHPIFGKRFKILGMNEWFEENCFEYIQ
jgi:hypothetical protein